MSTYVFSSSVGCQWVANINDGAWKHPLCSSIDSGACATGTVPHGD
jgi:hypothetical protein